jgi:hypothetical protein
LDLDSGRCGLVRFNTAWWTAEATAAQRQVSDTLAKSYRYLRLAMVGLLLCLAVAVVI